MGESNTIGFSSQRYLAVSLENPKYFCVETLFAQNQLSVIGMNPAYTGNVTIITVRHFVDITCFIVGTIIPYKIRVGKKYHFCTR